MFDQYISNLAYNINKPDKPTPIDIVLEGGANNGVYELGVLLFVKHLEREGYLTVERISGASIGSLMGFVYFADLLVESMDMFQSLKEYFRDHLHLRCYEDRLNKLMDLADKNVFETVKRNRLFIAAIDVNSKEQVVTSEFANRTELIEAIVKSSYLPYVVGETACYKTKFVDGCFPYIFTARGECDNKILYVSINRLRQMKFMFSVHREKNVHGRALHGILDAYTFFLYSKPTVMCSYVNDWSFVDYAGLRGKQCVATALGLLLLVCFRAYERVAASITRVPFANVFFVLVQHLYRDLVLYACF